MAVTDLTLMGRKITKCPSKVKENSELKRTFKALKALREKIAKAKNVQKVLEYKTKALVEEIQLRTRMNGGSLVCGEFSAEITTRKAYDVQGYHVPEKVFVDIKGV